MRNLLYDCGGPTMPTLRPGATDRRTAEASHHPGLDQLCRGHTVIPGRTRRGPSRRNARRMFRRWISHNARSRLSAKVTSVGVVAIGGDNPQFLRTRDHAASSPACPAVRSPTARWSCWRLQSPASQQAALGWRTRADERARGDPRRSQLRSACDEHGIEHTGSPDPTTHLRGLLPATPAATPSKALLVT